MNSERTSPRRQAQPTPRIGRRKLLLSLLVGGAAAAGYGFWPAEAEGTPVRVYKSPSCCCCGDWVNHMRHAGFSVHVVSQDDMGPIKQSVGVPAAMETCHTAVVDDGTSRYVLEGHVPAGDVRRLLAERPEAIGLAVPGMPAGAPGMEQGALREPYAVFLFGRDRSSVVARY